MIYQGKEFKEIPGFPGYFVSRDGVVISTRIGREKPKIRKPQKGSTGYLELSLKTPGLGYNRKGIHRLVAYAYLPRPDSTERLVINHKNGIKTDNFVENLEWVTDQKNLEHAGRMGLTSKCRPVAVIFGEGLQVTRFPSATACARTLGVSKDTVLWRLRSKGKTLFSDGMYYVYDEDVDNFFSNLDKDVSVVSKQPGMKPILMKDLTSGTITTFESNKATAEYLGVGISTISTWLKAKDQPVLPGLIQLKFANDQTPWREISDPFLELSKFTKTKIVVVTSKTGEVKFYSSAIECCKAMGLNPTTLSYRVKSKGKTLFSDGYYYCLYEDMNSPVN